MTVINQLCFFQVAREEPDDDVMVLSYADSSSLKGQGLALNASGLFASCTSFNNQATRPSATTSSLDPSTLFEGFKDQRRMLKHHQV